MRFQSAMLLKIGLSCFLLFEIVLGEIMADSANGVLLQQLHSVSESKNGQRVPVKNDAMIPVAASILAVEHCNSRNGTYIPALSGEEMFGCEGLYLDSTLWDIQSDPEKAVKSVIADLNHTKIVVGMGDAAIAQSVSVLGGIFGVATVSHSGANAADVNTALNPLFATTRPPRDTRIDLFAELLKTYGITFAGTILRWDSDGPQYLNLLATALSKHGIRINASAFLPGHKESILAAAQEAKESKLNVWLIHSGDDLAAVLDALVRVDLYGEHRLFLFLEPPKRESLQKLILKRPDLIPALRFSQSIQILGGDPSLPRFQRFNEDWRLFEREYRETINSYLPGGSHSAAAVDDEFSTELPKDFFVSTAPWVLNSTASYSYDAVAATCVALCRLHREGQFHFKGQEFHKVLVSSTFQFEGLSGRVKFDSAGGRDYQSVLNELVSLVVDQNGQMQVVPVGKRNESGWHFDRTKLRFPGNTVQFPLVSIPPSHNRHYIEPWARILGILYCMILETICLILVVWISRNWHKRFVLNAQPNFLLLFLIGVAISSTAIVWFSVDDGDATTSTMFASRSCNIAIWTLSIGTLLSTCAMIAKLYRIQQIFVNKRLRVVDVPVTRMVACVALIVTLDVMILATWIGVRPLEWTRTVKTVDAFGYPQSSYGSCQFGGSATIFTSILVAFHLIVYFVGGIVAFSVRSVDSEFQETTYLAIAVMGQAQLYIIGVPILLVISLEEQTARYLVLAHIVFLSNLGSTFCVFYRKLNPKQLDDEKKSSGSTRRRSSNPETSQSNFQTGNSASFLHSSERSMFVPIPSRSESDSTTMVTV